MRKTIVIATILLLLSPFIITGCNDQKEQELGKIKEQVTTLRMENSQLKKEIAKAKANESGITFTTFGLGATLIMASGLIVWVINRRRDDGTET